MRIVRFMVGTAFVASSILTASAQQQTFRVAPDKSEVNMTLKTNHEVVHGTFHVDQGSIQFDPSTSNIGGNVVIAAGSGNTGNGSRDKKMNKDILVVGKYSTVVFNPKSYSGTIASAGDSTIQVAGAIVLLGTSHEITIPMQIHIEGQQIKAKAQFVIPYVQWGVKDPSFLIWKTEKEVAIDLTLVGDAESRQ